MKTDRQTPRLRHSANRTAGWLCWLLILLAICGCNASAVASPVESASTVESQPTSLPSPTQNASPTSEAGPIAGDITEPSPEMQPTSPAETQPIVPSPQPAPVCRDPSELQAVFVTDLGLADGIAVPPDAPLRKIWRVRNAGECTWPEGVELVRVSGDDIPGPSRVPVQSAAPNQEIDVVVDLTAPKRSARYTSFWRFQVQGGQLFGAVVYLEIVVSTHANPPPIVALPSPTSAPTASPTSAPKPTPIMPSSPTPTQTQRPDDASPCGGTDARFGPLVFQANQLGMRLPCVTEPVSTYTGWMQLYWQEIDQATPPLRLRSLVIVRNDMQTIYVLDGKDAITYRASAYAYQNTWVEGMPEKMPACAPLVAPPGYTDPTHGIGKVWCEESLWNTIGWPEAAPRPAVLAIQGGSTNPLVEIRTGTEPPYLVAIDLEARTATIYQGP